MRMVILQNNFPKLKALYLNHADPFFFSFTFLSSLENRLVFFVKLFLLISGKFFRSKYHTRKNWAKEHLALFTKEL